MILAPLPEVVEFIADMRGAWFGYQRMSGFMIWPSLGRHLERGQA